MAQVIGEFSQWKYGDPPGPDPRDPKWLDVSSEDQWDLLTEDDKLRVNNQQFFVWNKREADRDRQLLTEFQTGTGAFAPGRDGPGGEFRDMEPRHIHEQLKARFQKYENKAVQNYQDLGYGENPYTWNKMTPSHPPLQGKDTDRRQLPPRRFIDKVYSAPPPYRSLDEVEAIKNKAKAARFEKWKKQYEKRTGKTFDETKQWDWREPAKKGPR